MFFYRGIFILCFIAVSVNAQSGWCDPKLCSGGQKHVACMSGNPQWAPSCDDPEQIKMTPKLKRIILEEHNKLRNQQALGQTSGYKAATRMATMTWDDTLASLAELNTLQCEMEHDKCRNTYEFTLAGQNLAENGDKTGVEIARWAPGYWFEEWSLAESSDITEYKRLSNDQGDWIAHFTQIVKDSAHKVGCGISKFNEGKRRKSLIVCNYSIANISKKPTYTVGSAASGCKTGSNPDFAGLCSVNEKYD
ncbi:antigen 5 like allergen Cul n 1-like [Sitodiplosis mosellana]|uniref:antigen 5 like allergen Cul n 1-like n=1 Tax=Sitodiplosis mosellana TaxID=263140 RepID=UPI002443A65E|nr:antigen 5 like allergen Cul n 1-like [Sitodiplosis mosellana]